MLNLIRSDLYEMRYSRSFFVCLIVASLVAAFCIASTALVRFVYSDYANGVVTAEGLMVSEDDNFADAFTKGFYSGLGEAKSAVDELGSEQVVEFYEKMENGTLSSIEAMKFSFGDGVTFPMLLSIFVSIYVCGEFTKKTIHNKISKGYSRNGIYASKLIVSLIASALLSLLTAVVYGIISFAVFGFANITDIQIYDYIGTVLCVILVNAAFSSLYVMVSVVLKNSVAAITVNVGFISTLSISLSLADMMSGYTSHTSSFWLGGLLTKLQISYVSPELAANVILLSGVYILLTTLLGLYSINKRDI